MTVPVGTIFNASGSTWKTTGPKRFALGGHSYPVIKCTKYGKEFKETNGFSANLVECRYREGHTTQCVLKENVKVSTEGEASGKRKRRIQFLEAEIAAYTKELEELYRQELS